MKIIEVRPDKPLTKTNTLLMTEAKNIYKIFLAGTIEMGNSEDWQREYINDMINIANDVSNYRLYKKGEEDYGVNADIIIIYNPRRETVPTDLDAQINWELDALEKCDKIYMNLEANSTSPISLLELGLYARSGKLCVTCPVSFYRYNNVRITCNKYNVPFRNNKKCNFDNEVK